MSRAVEPFAVNIDFDRVADLYDRSVTADFDVAFWIEVARRTRAPRLELMCGTGRLTLPILRAGLPVEGLDYSRGLLARLADKLDAHGLATELYYRDARDFELPTRYALVFIGFHAIAEVLSNEDKARVFRCARRHLDAGGELWLSAHNPVVRAATLDGVERAMGVFPTDDPALELAFSGQFSLDPGTGIAEGRQRYVFRRNRAEVERRELPIRFHLIPPEELVTLLEANGLAVIERFGNYDFSPFDAGSSPFFIVRCRSA